MPEPTEDPAVAKTAIAATLTEPDAAKRRAEAADDDTLLGTTLAHFRVEEELGAGGMGVVYRATDLSLDRSVALKVLPPEVSGDAKLRERFRREARAQARLRHPNICHIYFIGDDQERLFFAMELIEGQTVEERLRAEGKLAADEAIEICLGVACGLRAAHKLGFAHRDIKPSNVMLEADGGVKILDFGLVTRDRSEPVPGGGAVDQTMAMVGTPLYMAPEQANAEETDFRADIYSLGVTLHHLVSGEPPYSADTLDELITQHASAPRPTIHAGRGSPRNAPVVDELCDRMMAKRPEDRFDSYDELITVLERASERRAPSVRAFNRWVATAVDVFVTVVGVSALSAFVPIRGEVGILFFFAGLASYVTVAWARYGRTLGMASFRLRLVRTDSAGPPSWRQALARMWWAWSYSLVGFGLVLAGSSIRSQRIGAAMVLTGAVLIVIGFLRVLLVGVWSGHRAPRGRTPWDRKSHTDVVLDVGR